MNCRLGRYDEATPFTACRRVAPKRQETRQALWRVAAADRKAKGFASTALVEAKPATDSKAGVRDGVLVEGLVVVNQHDDTIYPGLVPTGEVISSGDREAPFHTVINSENLHALNL